MASAGLRPQHQFGQNFMVDQKVLGAIADAGEVREGDVVLEVGPGVGNLTRLLSQRVGAAGAVLAVDIDYKLMPAAQRYHAALTNVHWLNADVLAGKHEINPEVVAKLRELCGARAGCGLRLVSNLPYNAASPLVAELLVEMWGETKNIKQKTENMKREGGGDRVDGALFFQRMAFTVQWEVGERMRAAVGTRDYGPLGILIQLLGDVAMVRKIPPGAFWPPPKVHSGLVTVVPRRERFGRLKDAVALQRLLAGVFSHRRQKLLNGIKHYVGEAFTAEMAERLKAAGIDGSLRPESLKVEEFLVLAEVVGNLPRRHDDTT